jgi:hypothetical protein
LDLARIPAVEAEERDHLQKEAKSFLSRLEQVDSDRRERYRDLGMSDL